MPTYLVRRDNGRLYCRVRVPKDIRHLHKSDDVKLSLKTSDLRTAKERLPLALVEVQAGFADKRRRLEARPVTLDETGIQQMVLSWFHAREKEGIASASGCGADQKIVDEIEKTERELVTLDDRGGERVAAVTAALLYDNAIHVAWQSTNPLPVAMAKHHEMLRPTVTIDPSGDEYNLASGLVRRAMLEHVRRSRKRFAHADFSNTTDDPIFANGAGDNGADNATSITVAELCERYIADRGPSLTDRTVRDYRTMFEALTELLGPDLPLADIASELPPRDRPTGPRRVLVISARAPPSGRRTRNSEL